MNKLIIVIILAVLFTACAASWTFEPAPVKADKPRRALGDRPRRGDRKGDKKEKPTKSDKPAKKEKQSKGEKPSKKEKITKSERPKRNGESWLARKERRNKDAKTDDKKDTKKRLSPEFRRELKKAIMERIMKRLENRDSKKTTVRSERSPRVSGIPNRRDRAAPRVPKVPRVARVPKAVAKPEADFPWLLVAGLASKFINKRKDDIEADKFDFDKIFGYIEKGKQIYDIVKNRDDWDEESDISFFQKVGGFFKKYFTPENIQKGLEVYKTVKGGDDVESDAEFLGKFGKVLGKVGGIAQKGMGLYQQYGGLLRF